MKDNGGRRPEQILTEIHRTRDELEKTLIAIEHRLTPGQLVDHGIDYLRHSGANEFVQNLGGAAKQNPLPVALVGIGLAWLMALGRQPARRDDSSTLTSDLRDNAVGAMQSASETLSSTRERISGTVSAMRERASDVTDTARQQWERARDSLDYLVHEQPLALGAIGLAIGAVLGAAAPRTRVEEQMMGQASRNLGEKARQMGSEQLDKAEQAVKEVARPAQPQSTVSSPEVEPKPQVQIEPPDKGSW
jgi:ElaB/YqjD/DUF883 family membrane-anchored ribosome-binding protein